MSKPDWELNRPDLELRRAGPIYYKLGLVADPGPDILLNKEMLARLKVQILENDIAELRNQIKLAESYQGMLKELYKIR